MFAEAEDYSTAGERFDVRLHAFRRRCRVRHLRFPALRHHFWWVLHNVIVHPLIGLFPSKLAVRAHTVTSDGLNLRRGSKDPMPPYVPRYPFAYGLQCRFWWLVHNLVAHVLIGLLPFGPAFRFHDWTAERMHVVGWV